MTRIRPEYALVVPVFATRLVYLATLTLLPFLLLERGLSASFLGILVGVYGYAAVLMDLVAGTLADRFPPARLAALGSAGIVAAIGLLLGSAHVVFIAAARLLHGIAMGLFRPAVGALVLERVDESRRASAISVNNVAYVGGAAAGPLFAGLLADRFGVQWGMLACAAVAAVAAISLVAVVPGAGQARSGPTISIRASLVRLPSLVRSRSLLAPLVLVLADITILHVWLVYLPLYLTAVHGFSLTAASTLVSLEALLYSLAQSVWGRLLDRWGYVVPIAVSLLAHGALIAAIPIVGGEWAILAVLLGLCGALNAGAYPGCVALAAARVRDDERGRALGLLSAASDLGQALGPLTAAVAYQVSGRLDAALFPALAVAIAGLAAAWLSDRFGSPKLQATSISEGGPRRTGSRTADGAGRSASRPGSRPDLPAS